MEKRPIFKKRNSHRFHMCVVLGLNPLFLKVLMTKMSKKVDKIATFWAIL